MPRHKKINPIIGRRLRELRSINRKSQQVVADQCMIHQTTLGEYERGRCMPGPEVIRNLAEYFDVSLDFLLGRTDEKKNLNV